MKKIYYLSTCDTCKRIINELGITPANFEMQDIKTNEITAGQLDEMQKLTGSYESLFSRTARKYKELETKPNNESEYRKLVLEAYTFLKRPVIIIGKEIFIGNSKVIIEQAKKSSK